MSITLNTPEAISFCCLLSMRGRIQLEVKGMRCTGRSTTAIAKDKFGLPITWRKVQVLEFVTALIELHKEQPEGWGGVQVSPQVGTALRSYLNSLED